MWNRVSCVGVTRHDVFKIDLSREKVAFSTRRSPSFPIPVDYAPLRIAQSVSDDLRPLEKRGRHKKRRIEAAMQRIGIGTGSFSRYPFFLPAGIFPDDHLWILTSRYCILKDWICRFNKFNPKLNALSILISRRASV